VSQPSRVKLGIPSEFDGDRVQGCTMSCELYIMLTALVFIDEQVHIHWALSYFKGRCPDNPNTRQTLEYTKDKYNVKIIK
jgi:hypothetical protein